MCGRYTLISNADELVEFFQLSREFLPLFEPRYNIAPTQTVLTICEQDKVRQAEQMFWGLIPAWSQDGRPSATLINARGETLRAKPSFRESFQRRRCIVPATGFYEWQKLGKGKQPYYIRPAQQKLFAFAGLWNEWEGPKGEKVHSCCVVTTQANSLMASFHDRMPVILEKNDFAQWLDSANHDTDALKILLKPLDPLLMQASPVSNFVNSARNQGPKCLDAVVPEPMLF